MSYGSSGYGRTTYGGSGGGFRNLSSVLVDSIITASNFLKTTLKTKTESIGVSSVFSKAGTLLRNYVESIIVSIQAFEYLFVFVKVLTDSIIVTVSALTRATTKVITNSIIVASTLVSIVGYVRAFTESVIVTATGLLRSLAKIFTSSIIATDRSIIRAVTKVLTSTINVADTFVKGLLYFRTFTESVITSDVVTKVYAIGRVFIDAIVVSVSLIERRLNGVLATWTKMTKATVTAYSKVSKIATSWTKADKTTTSDWTKESKPQL